MKTDWVLPPMTNKNDWEISKRDLGKELNGWSLGLGTTNLPNARKPGPLKNRAGLVNKTLALMHQALICHGSHHGEGCLKNPPLQSIFA